MTAPSTPLESAPSPIGAADAVRTGLNAVESALGRLDDGTYGMCAGCNRPIEAEALAADPTVQTHAGCASPPSPLPGLA